MHLEIYLDILFFVNFCMDYFILKLLRIILKQKSSRIRPIIASSIGASAACFMALNPSLNGIAKFGLYYVAVSILMVKTALGLKGIRKTAEAAILLFLLTFVIGGMLNTIYSYTGLGYYFNKSFPSIIIYGGFCFIIVKISLLLLKWLKGQSEKFYETEIILDGKKISGTGLLDTGNSLREPLGRKPVIIAEYEMLKEIFPQELKLYIQEYYHPKEIEESISIPDNIAVRLRYIPFHSIGMDKGMLLGIICTQVNIHRGAEEWTREKDICVAVYEGTLSEKHRYNMILHEELL